MVWQLCSDSRLNGTFMTQHARIYPAITRDVCVTYTRSYHLDEEFILFGWAGEEVCPRPGVLVRSYYGFT